MKGKSMSFASTYANKPPNYKGMSMTVGIHALVFAGVMALPGIDLPERLPTILETYDVEKTKPEPVEKIVEPDKPLVESPPRPFEPLVPLVESPVTTGPLPEIPVVETASVDFSGIGEEIRIAPPIDTTPVPVIAEAGLNRRFSKQFQPDYPSGQLRLGTEGMVTVRVLVGANGRAKQIELVDTPHKDFWTATKRHALRKWRFNPATRDGRPFESWITLKVQFKITG